MINDSFYQSEKNKISFEARKKSALAKAKLLTYGVTDDPSLFDDFASFKEEHYAFDNGNWGVDKGRLIPSEVILPGGIVSKLHIRPDSHLKLKSENNILYIEENGKYLISCETLDRPNFWNYTTKKGVPTKELAHFYGKNCINFNIFSNCQFFNVDKQCTFCSVRETQKLHKGVKILKSEKDLEDVCQLATEHDSVEWFLMTGGSYLDSDREFDRHISVLKKIRHTLPWDGHFRGNVSLMPPKDTGRLRELYDVGVDHPSFNLEVWPKSAFVNICPGKETYVGYDHIQKSYDKLVDIYGEGKVWCSFVAGLVPLKDQKEGFTVMAEKGVIPGANIFHPEVGSKIGNSLNSPSEDYIIELYNHAADLYNRYNYKPFFDASVLRNSLANEAYEGLLS